MYNKKSSERCRFSIQETGQGILETWDYFEVVNVEEAGVFWTCWLSGCWFRQPGTIVARGVIMNSNERTMFQRATADITAQGEDW